MYSGIDIFLAKGGKETDNTVSTPEMMIAESLRLLIIIILGRFP